MAASVEVAGESPPGSSALERARLDAAHVFRTPLRSLVARRAHRIAYVMALMDLLLTFVAYELAKVLRIGWWADELPVTHLDPLVVATVPAWVLIFLAHGLYGRRRILEPAGAVTQMLPAVAMCMVMLVLTAFAFGVQVSRGWTALVWVLASTLLILSRLVLRGLVHMLNRHGWLGFRTLVVGVNGEARTLARVLAQRPYLGYEVVGFVETGRAGGGTDVLRLGSVEDIRALAIADDVGAVFVAGSDVTPDTLERIDSALTGLSVSVRTSLGVPHLAASRVVVQPVDGMAMLTVDRPPMSRTHLNLKRLLDLVVGIGILLVAAPIIVAVALALLVSSGRPVIFSQQRVGSGGRLFTMYKFRTMVKDAELKRLELEAANEAAGALFKMRRDPRVIPLGRHLRRFGLDELPQLVNILRGDMSLVGPRPALPSETAAWPPSLHGRLRAKPGLTGLWQVSGRHDLGFDDYVRYDLFYVQNWSLALDFQIIARTLPAVLSRKGAY